VLKMPENKRLHTRMLEMSRNCQAAIQRYDLLNVNLMIDTVLVDFYCGLELKTSESGLS
jgi:hypothetical protein